MRRALLTGAFVLCAAAPASADQLVFACGPDLTTICRARPDGTGVSDIAFGHAPELSRDGRRLAYVDDTDVFVRDMKTGKTAHATEQFLPQLIRFRPDGLRFAVAEGSLVPSPGTQVCSYNTDLSGTNEGRYCIASGVSSGMDYLPDGRLLMSRSGGSARGGRTVISLLRPEDGGPTGVERDLVDDPAYNLESPSVSPDGRFVAVVQAPLSGGTTGDIAIYDLATGDLVRRLTSGGRAAAPAFSPDGRRIAFDRGGSVWTTRATGTPGRARLVEAGARSASWGGGGVPNVFSRLRIAKRQRGDVVRGRLRIVHKGSALHVDLRARGKRAGRLRRDSVPKGTVKFAVRLTRPARKVTVRVWVFPPRSGDQRATRRVTLTSR